MIKEMKNGKNTCFFDRQGNVRSAYFKILISFKEDIYNNNSQIIIAKITEQFIHVIVNSLIIKEYRKSILEVYF